MKCHENNKSASCYTKLSILHVDKLSDLWNQSHTKRLLGQTCIDVVFGYVN